MKQGTPLDRLPPHSPEAEKGILGCCLLDQNAVAECVERFRGVEVFYDLRHQALFKVLREMFDASTPVDGVTVRLRLRELKLLDQVGGEEYLEELCGSTPSAANLSYYAEILREKAIARRLMQVCTQAVGELYECEQNADQVFDHIEQSLMLVSEARVERREKTVREYLDVVVDRIENFVRGGPQMLGLSTGFEYLDKMLLGMEKGDLIIIAARPGMGKTSFGMQVVEHLACDKKIPCGVFSMEMRAHQLVARLLFQRAKADFQRFRTGYLINEDVPKLTSIHPEIALAPIYLDDTSGVNVLEVRARARRWKRQYGVQFLLVDYMQLMRPTRYYNNREQEVAEISGGLKCLARELEIPIMCLAQLNRERERQKNRAPILADLRESGAIEQDADVVGIFYEPRKDDETVDSPDWSDTWRRINLQVAKQRNGPTGPCNFLFRKKSMRFEGVTATQEPEQGKQIQEEIL